MSTHQRFKIGLGLSGGGFRASIFHLGVIRRLEELGIMPEVDVISSVSGGSIVAAYYVCEMERRLRLRPRASRVKVFEEIAADFFRALDHNLRTRALVFSPFYHPLLFLRSLAPTYSRSDLMQREFDIWFYQGNTLDQLPSVTKLVLNTTSLMTGELVGFSRQPLSGLTELGKVNGNVLPLARIVGASAGVPVLFPPTPVSGDLLVDGGVADNQGIEALLENRCNILLISDASGQMEQVHRLSSSGAAVAARSNAILQFQVRKKLVERLLRWRQDDSSRRLFAFLHLFLNLKDRPGAGLRISSEYIPALARMRTDLDQFSFIEREALMFHGYTLIDAQIRKYCPALLPGDDAPPLKTPPLFAADGKRRRAVIRKELDLGRTGMLLARSLRKYPGSTLGAVAAVFAPLAALFAAIFHAARGAVFPWVADAFLAAFGAYVTLFAVYLAIRRISMSRDREVYRELTGSDPSTRW